MNLQDVKKEEQKVGVILERNIQILEIVSRTVNTGKTNDRRVVLENAFAIIEMNFRQIDGIVIEHGDST